jgi:hypothetical protein
MAIHKTTDADKVRKYLKAAIQHKYGTNLAFANKMDVSTQFISNVLNGVKPIPDWMCEKFGVKHVVTEHWEIRG